MAIYDHRYMSVRKMMMMMNLHSLRDSIERKVVKKNGVPNSVRCCNILRDNLVFIMELDCSVPAMINSSKKISRGLMMTKSVVSIMYEFTLFQLLLHLCIDYSLLGIANE